MVCFCWRSAFHVGSCVLGALLAFSLAAYPQSADAMPRTMQDLRNITEQLVKTGLVHGDIPSLNSPAFVAVREASMGLEANDPVFVVPLPDGVRIYPQKILVWHEVVNEVIKGEPFCITYCPLRGCLALYASRAGD